MTEAFDSDRLRIVKNKEGLTQPSKTSQGEVVQLHAFVSPKDINDLYLLAHREDITMTQALRTAIHRTKFIVEAKERGATLYLWERGSSYMRDMLIEGIDFIVQNGKRFYSKFAS